MAFRDISNIEARVLEGLCEGKTLFAIAEELDVSVHSVNIILKSARERIGAKSVFDAIRIYRLHKNEMKK